MREPGHEPPYAPFGDVREDALPVHGHREPHLPPVARRHGPLQQARRLQPVAQAAGVGHADAELPGERGEVDLGSAPHGPQREQLTRRKPRRGPVRRRQPPRHQTLHRVDDPSRGRFPRLLPVVGALCAPHVSTLRPPPFLSCTSGYPRGRGLHSATCPTRCSRVPFVCSARPGGASGPGAVGSRRCEAVRGGQVQGEGSRQTAGAAERGNDVTRPRILVVGAGFAEWSASGAWNASSPPTKPTSPW